MTAAWRACVAIACPNAPYISRQARRNGSLSGTLGLRFRTIADMTGPSWHEWNDTANAVGLHGPPGFKSPILRHLSSGFTRRFLTGRPLLSAFLTPCAHDARTWATSGPAPIPFRTCAAARASVMPGFRSGSP